jgi:hypothetical protein
MAAHTAAPPAIVNAANSCRAAAARFRALPVCSYFGQIHLSVVWGDEMYPHLRTGFAILICLAAAACAEDSAGLARPNAIIVREFALNQAAITLDPSFGFSLHRGTPGVPPRERAASVGRAVAFSVSDAIVEQLHQAGYDAIRSDGASAEPGGRALIVTGAIRHIDEGQRRHIGSQSVAASGEIDYRMGAGAAPQRLANFSLDSRQVARERVTGALAGRNEINAAAVRLGHAIAQSVLEVARRQNWPGASR